VNAVRFEHSSQRVDVLREVALFDVAVRPKRSDNNVLANHASRLSDEEFEQFHGFWGNGTRSFSMNAACASVSTKMAREDAR
jgi:hypothetical protein